MAKHDVIVIGASAGGVDALRQLVCQFPPDIQAAIFVIVHISPRSKSLLPHILRQSGKLRRHIRKTEHQLSTDAFMWRLRITI